MRKWWEPMISDILKRFIIRPALVVALIAADVGCRPGPQGAAVGGEAALEGLPGEVAALMPLGAVLCLDETARNGAYRLWIFRGPGTRKLDLPQKPRAIESHDRPASALKNLLTARLPNLVLGDPAEPKCRFSHWKLADGAEIQIRELIAGGEWFASVERISL